MIHTGILVQQALDNIKKKHVRCNNTDYASPNPYHHQSSMWQREDAEKKERCMERLRAKARKANREAGV